MQAVNVDTGASLTEETGEHAASRSKTPHYPKAASELRPALTRNEERR